MRQVIAQKISNAILDWRDAETLALIHFPFAIQSKQAPGRGHSKRAETKTFEMMVAEIAQEQVPERIEEPFLGLRLCYVAEHRKQDLDNCFKSVQDGLKQTVVRDDSCFDYIEGVRVKAELLPTDVGFTVEILKRVAKREAWV